MFCNNKQLFEFMIEETKLEQYVWTEAYEAFKKYLKNYIVDAVNKDEYEKVSVAKDILTWLIVLEKSKKKSWHFI